MSYIYDAFICHASEDKETFVHKLVEELRSKDLTIWYDEFTLTVGDSLLGKINEGLLQSKYGIVIFSKAFFRKHWPKKELEGLVALEADGHKKILPVWLDITRDDILQTYPILANLCAADASKGMQYVVEKLLEAIELIKKPNTQKHIEPTLFFSQRIADAFPGIRGSYETTDIHEIIPRLNILLKEPLQFEGYYPSLMMFPGDGGTLDIYDYKTLDESHVLIHGYELKIKKLVAYRPTAYWQSFLYLECHPNSPTGLYKNVYEYEEYAIYQEELVTRAEYDDRCIFRDGKSISISGAELRIRPLVTNNLIISSRSSPINDVAFDEIREQLLTGILDGSKTLENFIEAFDKLPRYNRYHPNS